MKLSFSALGLSEQKLYILSWIIFAVGCGLSQSLMSLGSILLLAWLFYLSVNRWQSVCNLQSFDKIALVLCLSWILILFIKLQLLLTLQEAFERSRSLPLFLIPFLVLLKPLSRENFWKVLRWAFLAYSINVFYSAYQYFVQQIEGAGFFKNPIYFAYNIFPAFLFITLFVRYQGSFLKTFKIPLAAVVLFLGVAFSNNRMTLALSFVLGAYCYLPLIFRKWKWRGLALGAGALLLLFFSFYHLNPWLHDKLVRTSWGLAGPSIQARLAAWQYNWGLFLENPLFGVGYTLNGINTAELVEFQKHWRPGYDIYAHSIFLQSLAESGLIGTILLFSFLLLLAKSRFYVQRFLLFMALAGLTENFFHNSKPLMAFLFFTAMALNISKFNRYESIEL